MSNKKCCSVIGLGRLGICFALTLERSGYMVMGVDIDEDRVDMINKKTLKSYEQHVEEYLAESQNLKATLSLEYALECVNMLFVTVRTDSLSDGRFDHSQIDNLVSGLKSIGYQPTQKHLIICSNVMPGYSDSVASELGKYNYIVSYNPELIAQGRILYDQSFPDLVVIGEANKKAGDQLKYVYRDICKSNPKIHTMDRLSAELFKVSLNCYLTVKITFANILGDIAIKSNADYESILKALGDDGRIGGKYLGYGFGYGGPCFPRDNDAFISFAETCGIDALISKAVVESNKIHLDFQVKEFCKHNDIDTPVVIDSVTYKNDVVIITASQQLLFAVNLAKKGYKVIIKEHKEVIRQVKELYGNLFKYKER